MRIILKKKENCLGDPLLLSKKNLKKLNKLKKLTKMRWPIIYALIIILWSVIKKELKIMSFYLKMVKLEYNEHV